MFRLIVDFIERVNAPHGRNTLEQMKHLARVALDYENAVWRREAANRLAWRRHSNRPWDQP